MLLLETKWPQWDDQRGHWWCNNSLATLNILSTIIWMNTSTGLMWNINPEQTGHRSLFPHDHMSWVIFVITAFPQTPELQPWQWNNLEGHHKTLRPLMTCTLRAFFVCTTPSAGLIITSKASSNTLFGLNEAIIYGVCLKPEALDVENI